MSDHDPVRLVLTPEQREQIHRVSGQHVEAIELERDDSSGQQGPLRFRWRLSASSGIPRQVWIGPDDT